METAIWIAQVLLAGVLALAGGMKLALPKERLRASGQAWVEDFSQTQVRTIGALEVLAAAGLILPSALGIAPILTPLAACGTVLLMLGAAATHWRRGERSLVIGNLVLLALAVFVAVERFGPYSL